MGAQSSTTSIFTPELLRNLQQNTPLNFHDKIPYQFHSIISHSPQHHHHIQERIRIKKNYTSPHVIKIIDSHTLQSHTFCSNIIKTFIIVEKPQSLQLTIQKGKSYFTEYQLWLIMYSCSSGIQFFMKNGLSLTKLTKNKIFIDSEGWVKIADPELSESLIQPVGATEKQILKDLGEIIKDISFDNYSEYSDSLKQMINHCIEGGTSFDQIMKNFNSEYLSEPSEESSPSFSLNSFQLLKKRINLTINKSSKTMQNSTRKQQPSFQCRLNTTYSYKSHSSQGNKKQNILSSKKKVKICAKKILNKENQLSFTNYESEENTNPALFTFKNPLKQLANTIDKEGEQNDGTNHQFPKKGLLKQRKKSQKEGKKINQKGHLISFQVDQETLVCQVEKDKSSYIWQLLNTKRLSEISFPERQPLSRQFYK